MSAEKTLGRGGSWGRHGMMWASEISVLLGWESAVYGVSAL